jgi:CheY-like chemotaxis protein
MKPLNVLFVDDDKFLLDMYITKFTNANYSVHASTSTEDALKVVKGGLEPDILILDLIMPGMDGMELLSVLRKENLIKKTVVIMLTNQGLPDDIARAKKLNVDGYIIKAATIPSDLLAEVEKIYSHSKKQ